MMKKSIKKQCILLITLLVVSFSFAKVPTYYDGLSLITTGEDLKTNLAVLITNTHTTNLTYTPGVWEALQQTDLDPVNSNDVLLIFDYSDGDSNYVTDKSSSKDLNGGSKGDWDREHTYHSDMMDIFLEGNVEDPVSQYQINRNVLLEGIQGNRNPFIDKPAFVTSILGGPQAEDRFNATDADAVALYAGDATTFEIGTAITTDNLVDAFVYDTNDNDDAELLVLLNDGETQINEDETGNKDAQSSQRFPNGSGGLRNTATYQQAIPTPGVANVGVVVIPEVNLIINEVDADTAGTDTLEFVELYDGGVGNTSLDGFVIVMYNGSSDTSYGVYDLAGQATNEEGYFVLGNTDVANVNMVFASNGLQNGADAVALYTGDATAFKSGTVITTDGLIDALVYDTDDADDEGLLVLLNDGQLQINEAELGDKDGDSLQRIPNGTGGARNTDTYTQAIPSPGTENGAIIEAPDVISIAEARALDSGELVTVEGVLTVSDQFSGSAYIQDSTGGIAIFDELVYGDGNFMIGDSIKVTGTRSLFSDQVQISTVIEVVNNGLPNTLIEPLTITLSELADHPAELVRIINPVFPAPGEILFGNSNYEISDATGTGELRIDNDVTSIVGLGQPETCSEIIGVVGRFYEVFQLLPRLREDLSCAEEYTAPDTVVSIDKEKAFDVVTWNIEWFGDETNSPAAGNTDSDLIQKDSVKTVIRKLNADIYAVQEISDETLLSQMVSELSGYDYLLSDATSYPNDTEGTQQKVGYIYNTETVEITDTKVLLASIHPYYNGGDESALADYPDDDKTRFYASGRLPFMVTANVTIDGNTEQINLVNLHARANSSTGAQDRYDMRKYDVEVLKDSLDAHYANTNLIVLGDYNDDVDVTVADDVTSTVSTYEAYVNDATNYNIVTANLSDQGYRSYAFRENMIDHIMISDELFEGYVDASEQVHYEFYDSDYTTTSSDHFPVSFQLQLASSSLDINSYDEPTTYVTNLNVYPNSFKDYLNISFDSSIDANAELIIYNLKGSKVFENSIDISEGNTKSTLNLDSLIQGVYYLKTTVNGVIQETKLLIKR